MPDTDTVLVFELLVLSVFVRVANTVWLMKRLVETVVVADFVFINFFPYMYYI